MQLFLLQPTINTYYFVIWYTFPNAQLEVDFMINYISNSVNVLFFMLYLPHLFLLKMKYWPLPVIELHDPLKFLVLKRKLTFLCPLMPIQCHCYMSL